MTAPQPVLFDELNDATFSFQQMEQAYKDGIEDTVEKIVNLIRQSDYEISLDDIVSFCEAEVGYTPPESDVDDLFADLPEPGPLTIEALRDAAARLGFP